VEARQFDHEQDLGRIKLVGASLECGNGFGVRSLRLAVAPLSLMDLRHQAKRKRVR
jgi:hypothetical protein